VNTVGWQRWREAEAKLGTGAALETAAAKLPPRQAAILRALDALERGDRASIKAVAQATQDLDIGAVLDLVQAAPGDIDPTAVRAGLKRGGLTNAPLPTLDLLRHYSVALVDHGYSNVPAALTKAAQRSTALRAAMIGLSPGATAYTLGAELSKRSPRLTTLWAAAAGVMRGASGSLRQIVARIDPTLARKGVALDPARWPDVKALRGGAAAPFGGVEENTLERWLAAPLETRWDMGCQSEVDGVLQGPRDERRRLLGRLLAAIERVVREGLPHEALPAIDGARELVVGLSGLPAQELLLYHLSQLHLRLLWWADRGGPAEIAEALWRLPAPLTQDERRHLAATLLAAIGREPDDTTGVAEMLILHYQDPHQVAVEALSPLLRHARSVRPEQLREGLRDAAPWHRELVLAVHASATGLAVDAFERGVEAWLAPAAGITAQLDRARVAAAAYVMRIALHDNLRFDTHPRHHWERLATAASRWFDAVAAKTIEVDAKVLAACVELTKRSRHLGRAGLQQARIAALVRQWLATPSQPGAELSLERARLAISIGDEAVAEASFRALGRALREAPKERALTTALRWCAGLQLEDDEEPHPTLTRWQKALDAWVLQQPKALVASTALNFAGAEPELAQRLYDWALETIDDRDWATHWQALQAFMLRNVDFGPDFDSLLADQPGLEEALAKLHELALGGAPPGFTGRRRGGRRG